MNGTFGDNFLGIDWGASDVGVSFADAETRIAFSLTTLRNDRTLLSRLGGLFSERGIGTVVIGIPSYVNRKESVYEGERFGEAVLNAFPGIGIAYQDEMFTTKMAEANLRERGIKRISRFDDQEAARIILQEWLDRGGSDTAEDGGGFSS
ncbi:MAG: pre-16S rRNA-processing nuclease YqgF [Candidatus Moranbacteria bacterium]|nr:pre-16S rRNA-processing nuclease YqgF [Candidatus Moranbacteria bacterium]NTW46148.1 pre-16S rRNA-processing nuclease YqgF [Candidatus Moranbacteria bacterium]